MARIYTYEKIIESIFFINDEIKLNIVDKEYLEDEILHLIKKGISKYGISAAYSIREEIGNKLYVENKSKLIKYLSLDIDSNTIEKAEKLLNSPDFLKIESKEQQNDLYKSLLNDDRINDIRFSLMGRIKTSEGSKEIFLKKSEAYLDYDSIDIICTSIGNFFDKSNLISKKEDEEVAEIIKFTVHELLEYIFNLPYQINNTENHRAVSTIIVTKLFNGIGLIKDYRDDFYAAINEGYKSTELSSNSEGGRKVGDILD